jgi:ATP-binding cassette subfamily C exporter for protease/lipase
MKKIFQHSELRTALLKNASYIRQAFIFTLIANLLSLAPVGYMKDVYGPVLNSRSETVLIVVTLMLIGFLVASGFLEWVRFRLMQAVAVGFNESMGRRVFQASYKSYLQSRSSTARLALQDLKTIRSFLSSPGMLAILDTPVSIFFIALVYLIHPRMGVVTVTAVALLVLIAYWTELKVRPNVKEAQKANAQAQLYVADGAGNAQTIQAMGMMNAVQKKWESIQRDHIEKMAEATRSQSLGSSLSKFIMIGQGSVVLGLGCWLTLMGDLPDGGGAMIIASIIGGRAIQPLVKLIGSWKSIVTAGDAYSRLDEFLSENPEPHAAMKLPAPRGVLHVDNLSARAPGSKAVILSSVTFSLKQGMCLAVMGPSGSGKSSLARMLVGVWPSLSGSIRLDDVDIYSWSKDELGCYLGYLPQDIELLEGTIAENICRFGEIHQDKLEKAIDLVGLSNFIDSLTYKLNTQVGEDGTVFSGGQRQRLGLARAIYGDPKFIVLDEPNANLDIQGTQALYKLLQYLKEIGTTVVVVTHKKDILKYSDRILVMKGGKPKIFGPRDLVLEKLAGKDVKSLTAEQASNLAKNN